MTSADPVTRANLVLHRIGASRTYGRGASSHEVGLQDLDLCVNAGESLGLLGGRNDGIELLVHLISGSARPESGNVFQSEYPLVVSPRSGFTEEETLAFNLSRMGMARQVNGVALRKVVELVLDEAGMAEASSTRVGDVDPMTLGTVAIYMGIALGASLLVFEDPEEFSAILEDEDVAAKIAAFRLRGGSTVFAGSNPRTLGRLCDRIIWLKEGRVVMAADSSTVIRWHSQVAKAIKDRDHVRARQLERRLQNQFPPDRFELLGAAPKPRRGY
ncbi:hypothetical protein GCM10022377_02230 [Zhihengliuella alba]|uniref:ABC transporter domain-containing protein n=1 Tax=Zhihengliuella alba TaxID=547018 RepID=A0ABP7CRR6_9MICC